MIIMDRTILCSLIYCTLFFGVFQSWAREIHEEIASKANDEIGKKLNFDKMLQKYNLTSFRSLLIKAKVFDRLNVTSTSYTVFAPTNDAIMKAESLLTNATRLPEVLLYHVHLGAFTTSEVKSNMRLKTLLKFQKKIRLERYNGVRWIILYVCRCVWYTRWLLLKQFVFVSIKLTCYIDQCFVNTIGWIID